VLVLSYEEQSMFSNKRHFQDISCQRKDTVLFVRIVRKREVQVWGTFLFFLLIQYLVVSQFFSGIAKWPETKPLKKFL
jgi:hypothetical protein